MKRTIVLIICVIAAALLWFPRPSVRAGAEPATAAPESSALLVAPGRVEPFSEEVKVGSELDGKLQSVLVDEGSWVRRGQLIAVIHNSEFVARVESAHAAVSEKEAELERAKNGSRPMERDWAKASLREAVAIRAHAAQERERRRSILEQGAISRAEFDSADREQSVAEARLEAARQHLALVEAAPREDELHRIQADLDQARARLREAQAELDKTSIDSPMSGIVLHRYLQSGESVSRNGSPIVTLGDTSRLRVRAEVDETDVAKLRVGQAVYVLAAAYGNQKFTGSVSRIGQALGRKRIRTDEPTERVDTKFLETLIDLDPGVHLPLGLRVDAFLN